MTVVEVRMTTTPPEIGEVWPCLVRVHHPNFPYPMAPKGTIEATMFEGDAEGLVRTVLQVEYLPDWTPRVASFECVNAQMGLFHLDPA